MQDREKLKIAFFTPIVEGSKSYYFSTKVLPYLKEKAQVDIFTDTKCLGTFCGLNVYNYLTAFIKDNEEHYDIFFYQVESLDCTNFIRVHLSLIPGIVLFHDFYLYNNPPQTIVPYLLGSQYNNIKRDIGKALFSLFTSLAFMKKATVYSRNNISLKDFPKNSTYDNNVSFIPYPLDILEFKEKTRNIITKIVFEGSVEKESRYFSVIKSLENVSDYKFTWLTDKKSINKAIKICNDNNIKNFEILENNVINIEDSLLEAHIAICPIKNLEYFNTFFIYKALSNNVFVIVDTLENLDSKGDDLRLFPNDCYAKARVGLNESKEIAFFINAYKEGKIKFDYKNFHDKYLNNLSSNIVANELLTIFKQLYDSVKDYQKIYENQKECAKIEVLKKAFSEYDDYLLNERKELGLI